MEKPESIETFYKRKLNWMPDNLKKEIGHFNVFRMKDFVGPKAKAVPYNRKDYFKISLIIGRNTYYYADKTIEIKDSALLFANPMIPYKWEPIDDEQDGCFIIFTETFFSQFGNIKEYPVFQPGTSSVFFPTKKEVKEIRALYDRIFEEMRSEYVYKYDLMRAIVIELIHKAIKMKPADSTFFKESNANTRISSLFVELLERQFPIESDQQRMRLRKPIDYADHLSVHINHLNRALKTVTGKTTSQLIDERILQEARILLQHTDWNISAIGYCLGFDEPSHFISFFKRNSTLTPSSYRRQAVV